MAPIEQEVEPADSSNMPLGPSPLLTEHIQHTDESQTRKQLEVEDAVVNRSDYDEDLGYEEASLSKAKEHY